MIYRVLSVRDRAADIYSQPFFTASIGAAIRGFGDEINKEGSPVGAHAEDYDLYEIGAFDDSSGELVDLPKKMIAVGKDLKIKA